MGIKKVVTRAANSAGNVVAKASSLSSAQCEELGRQREQYLTEMPAMDDSVATELTNRLIAAAGVEIFDAYLPQMGAMYVPVDSSVEYGASFKNEQNIRYFNITKWVVDATENSLEKLVNVYGVLAGEACNIALVFHRRMHDVQTYLAVVNLRNSDNRVDADLLARRIEGAVRGNFPGSELGDEMRCGRLPCLSNLRDVSVASVSNVPTEKSEKFASQTIEKLLDGIVPRSGNEEYTVVLLATPVQDVDERKLRLQQLHTGLSPYAGWETGFTYNENQAQGSSATVGVNAGVSVGQQQGANSSLSDGESIAESENRGVTDSAGENVSDSSGTSLGESVTDTLGGSLGVEKGAGLNVGLDLGAVSVGANTSGSVSVGVNASRAKGKSRGTTSSHSIGKTTSRAVSSTLGRAVTRSLTSTVGAFASTSLGGNFGVNFARSSTVTSTIGKNESITRHHMNYSIKHAIDLLEEQMKRLEQGSAMGLWDFAAYIVGDESSIVSNVAHTYLALTQGEQSYISQGSINVWRGDLVDDGRAATICEYLADLRHPLFGLNPALVEMQQNVLPYPATTTATTALTGKELARSLNFPKKSVSGLPVFECASFGRNVAFFDEVPSSAGMKIGCISHMHHCEPTPVHLDADSLTGHVFVTGSTGTGKSNAVCRILEEAVQRDVGFLVVEPAKGEYKDVFGNDDGVKVFGTNSDIAPLLRLNPFSFPAGIHVLEHVDRLIEIFNVCWPMYAAMPAVLKDAVERSYADCGWDLLSSENPFGRDLFPTFADVAQNVREIIDSSEYDSENKGAYKGSLLTRLQSLANGINGLILGQDEIASEELFDGRTVIDLSRVGSTETKSLLMGVLVLKLQEYRMTQGVPHNSGLRHITVLEEAHNLLRREAASAGSEGPGLAAKSVEMLSNAIAEMRTYGEGFVIADQAPGLVDRAAIRNTNTKIVLRLPEGDDRRLVGGAMALTDAQVKELARLPRGVAAVYQNNWIEAVLCQVDRARHGDSPYAYDGEGVVRPSYCAETAVRIATLLSFGERVGDEGELRRLMDGMKDMGVRASVRVQTARVLTNPPKDVDATMLVPIMSELFPRTRSCAANPSALQDGPVAWTDCLSLVLEQEAGGTMNNRVQHAIIQAIAMDYFLRELNDAEHYAVWDQAEGAV